MQIINEARKDINKIWGQPSVKDTHYRPLKYLLEVPVDEGLLVHNVVSGELVLLEGDEIEQFHAPGPKPATAGSLSADCPDEATVFSDLVAKHFIVPQDFDEHASVLNLRKILRLLDTDKSITGYTILPTTYCNARCFYCYEADFEHIHMSDETADQVVEFIAKNHGGHRVSIEWFGGEPLIGSKIISRICQGLRNRKIEFASRMTSNGYLFDEELIQIAKDDWNLKNIQITLDGTEEIYNKVKNYQGVKDNPYQRVMRNIELLLEAEIQVVVRMNLDYHNYDNLERLSDELEERFAECKNLALYTHAIFENEGFDKISHTNEERNTLLSKEDALNEKLISATARWNNIKLPALKSYFCMADNDKSVIVYSDGTLAKCEHCPDERLGTLQEGVTKTTEYQSWKESIEFEDCDTCNLYPVCKKLKRCFDTRVCKEKERININNKIIYTDKLLLENYLKNAKRMGE